MEKQIVDKLESIDTKMSTLCEAYTMLVHAVCDKKKKVDKKKNVYIKLKRNIYTKKKDGTLVIEKSFDKLLDDEQRYFYVSMAKQYPSLCALPEPLSAEDYEKLKRKFGLEKLTDKIADLDNYKYVVNYKSAYKTLLKWCRK